MKTRNGFVSNSSSSSFVVAFPELPTSVEHVKKMMFGDLESFPNPYADISYRDSEPEYSTMKIAETVFYDIQQQVPNDEQNILQGLEGWLDGAPDRDFSDIDFHKDRDRWNEAWEKYENELDEYRKSVAKSFVTPRKNMFIYTFEYSDNDGDYSTTLEHGGIFNNLDHIQVSRH